MAARNELRKIKKVNKYIHALNKRCVFIKRTYIEKKLFIIYEMRKWCTDNIGEKKVPHPLDEAFTGWISRNSLGEWAITFDINSDSYIFWFKRHEDKMLFNLVWDYY